MDAPPINRHPQITNLRKPIWLRGAVMGISRFPIRPGVDLRNIIRRAPEGLTGPRFDGQCFNGVCVLCLAQSKEKSICPLGCFGARMDGRRSITEPVLLFRSHAQGTRQTDISRISTNFLRKLSTGPQRKRRTMMPRGPKGENRPADAIGNAVMIAKIATGLRISNPPA